MQKRTERKQTSGIVLVMTSRSIRIWKWHFISSPYKFDADANSSFSDALGGDAPRGSSDGGADRQDVATAWREQIHSGDKRRKQEELL